MRNHLKGCSECRKTLIEYRELSALMTARLVTMSCPPAPRVSRATAPLRLVISPRLRKYASAVAALAACFAFFVAGNLTGAERTKNEMAKNISPVAVATPSMWAARGASAAMLSVSVETEQPFTESISRYRSSIGEELRKSDVDWMKVRELIEAMGELRTDLELLTIHMAYLDISTGNSPYEVAAHWENLGDVSSLRNAGADQSVVKR
jgi:hypothetical protein